MQNHGSYGKLRYGLGLLDVHAALNEYGRAGLMHDFQAKLRDLTSAFRLVQSAAVPLVSADGELNPAPQVPPDPLEAAKVTETNWV